MFKRSITVLAVVVMIVSAIAPFAGVAGAQGGGPPSGMVGVPSDNVGPPDHANAGGNGNGGGPGSNGESGGPPDHAGPPEGAGPPDHVEGPPSHVTGDPDDWSVHSSGGSDTLYVTIGSVDGQLALTLGDAQNPEGREVAVDATTLEDALGERPGTVYGVHDQTGEDWEASVEYEDGYAVWDVPHFSTNTVTFSGEISLTGSPAEDGTQYTYDLADSEEISDINVTLTGNENRINETKSGSYLANGDSVSYDVDGTTAPERSTVKLTGSWEDGVGDTILDDTSMLSGGNIPVGAVVGDEIAFSQGGSNRIIRYDVNGNSVWDDSSIHSGEIEAIESDDSWVYTLQSDGTLRALSDDGGSVVEEWSTTLSASDGNELYYESGTLYATGGTQLYAVDASTGSVNWNYDNTDSLGDVAFDSGSGLALVYDDVNDVIKGVDPADQTVTTTLSGSDLFDAHDGVVYQRTGTDNDRVRAAYVSNDTEIWNKISSADYLRSINYDPDLDYISATGTSQRVVVYDPSDGEETNFGGVPGGGAVADLTSNYRFGVGTDGLRIQTFGVETEDPSVSIDGTTVLSHEGRLNDGETISESVSVPLGSNTLDLSTSSSTVADAKIEVEEITETVDPALIVNGDRYDEFDTLADGESTTLDVSEVSLSNGTNTVDVVVSESYDGPIGQVGLDYSHAATSEQSVDYDSEAFSERYNVSKTFASDQKDASLTIPFTSTIVDVRNLEMRTNSGEWSTVSSSNFQLDNSTLIVGLGNVAAEDTVEVRTTATKVRVNDGSITVTDPTILGDALATEIRLEEKGSDFTLGVSSTAYDDELHYTYSESWSNAQSHARVENDGSQELRLPNAGQGATTRIGTIDLGVEPQSGHADVRIADAGSEPELVVRDSSTAETIDFEWRETTSGHVYQLWSITADVERDRGEASSPVTLTYDGSGGETLAIFDLGTGGSGGGGGGGATSTASTNPILLILAVVGGLAGLFLVSRRTGDESISGMALFTIGALIVGVLAIQSLAPAILADWIGRGISEALPLVLLAGAVIVVVWLRQRGDDTNLTFEVGER